LTTILMEKLTALLGLNLQIEFWFDLIQNQKIPAELGGDFFIEIYYGLLGVGVGSVVGVGVGVGVI